MSTFLSLEGHRQGAKSGAVVPVGFGYLIAPIELNARWEWMGKEEHAADVARTYHIEE